MENFRDIATWFTCVIMDSPRRLLDWSSSPYVAAYFAFKSSSPKDRAIYAYSEMSETGKKRRAAANLKSIALGATKEDINASFSNNLSIRAV